MVDIRFVDRADQAEWLVEPSWESFMINATDRKRAIYNWLEDNAVGVVVISSDGRIPVKGDTGWITKLHGNQIHYRIFFEDHNTAMIFKLTWA